MIKLRERKLVGGGKSYYLDIHHNGERMQKFLKIKTEPGNTPAIRAKNKENLELIRKIMLEYERDLLYGSHNIPRKVNPQVDFFTYYEIFIENLNVVNPRRDRSILKKLKAFAQRKTLSFSELNESFFRKFYAYLNNHLNGETPYDYFKKMARVVEEAVKDGYLRVNHAKMVKTKRGNTGIKKDVLTSEELCILANTACKNPVVKRAFLLCSCTGLRFCDVYTLTWDNIRDNAIHLTQSKTGIPVHINLNPDAVELIGEAEHPHNRIFQLPSHTRCLTILKDWTAAANVQKHITWHCARHSFGTNLSHQKIDVAIISKLLGHNSLDFTMNYVRLSSVLAQEAANSLPRILTSKNK